MKRKHKGTSLTPSSANHSIIISTRGRRIHIKHQSDDDSSDNSDMSNEEYSNSKRYRSSSKDYQSILNELHRASENFIQSNQSFQINNEHFNDQSMTKLPNNNLHINYFRDCLLEQDDHQFLNSINSYLEQFRRRLISYFTYMRSDVYREHLKKQLDNEIELNKTLKAKINSLENNIKTLLEDAICLLKLHTNELGIEELERPAQLITYANDISNKHKELRSKVATLEREIVEYGHENDKINFILRKIQTNGHQSSITERLLNDNKYSTLLANMSRQTQQQDIQQQLSNTEHCNILPAKTNQLSYIPISPNNINTKEFGLNLGSNQSIKCL